MDLQTRETIISHFIKVYNEADKTMLSLNPFCKKGCSWCCYQSVEILNWEEAVILDYLQSWKHSQVFQEVLKNLERWFSFFENATCTKTELTMYDAFDILHAQQADSNIACPFLVDHCCAIYPVRPLCCRCHIATGNARKCKADPLNDSIPEAEAYREKVVNEIVRNVPTTLRLLPFSVAPFFGLGHKVKQVHYTRLTPL